MFLIGQKVQITPKTQAAKAFWAFVEGWTGVVEGVNTGHYVVVCHGLDTPRTFFVEPENLTAAP